MTTTTKKSPPATQSRPVRASHLGPKPTLLHMRGALLLALLSHPRTGLDLGTRMMLLGFPVSVSAKNPRGGAHYNLLMRLRKAGLVSSTSGDKGVHYYALTSAGQKEAAVLQARVEELLRDARRKSRTV